MDSSKKEQAAVYEVIGVNGAGGISDVYLENMIRRFPTIRVKAVCSRQLEKARMRAKLCCMAIGAICIFPALIFWEVM